MDEYRAYLLIKANHDWVVIQVPQGYVINFNQRDYFAHTIEQAVTSLIEDCSRRGIKYNSLSTLISPQCY